MGCFCDKSASQEQDTLQNSPCKTAYAVVWNATEVLWWPAQQVSLLLHQITAEAANKTMNAQGNKDCTQKLLHPTGGCVM